MKCKNCNKELDYVSVLHGVSEKINKCDCGNETMVIPLDFYENLSDVKCPYCGESLFCEGDPKLYITKYVRISILGNEKDII